MNQFQATAVNINYPTFGKWLSYYYRAWTGQEPKCILREFNNFHMKNDPFDDKTYQQFKDDVLSYWCYIKDATDELGLVACRIFGICVNAASMPKALNMSKLRADITYQHRHELDDLFSTFFNTASTHDNTTTQTMHNNAAITQTTHSDTTSTQMTRNNTTLTHSNTNIDSSDKTQNEQDNKDEDNEECDLPYISKEEFGEYLQEWIEMLDEEEEADIIEDQDDYVELDDIIYPAIDENAKWKLFGLFCSLELPFH
ncbi:hypothetical protein C2G38_2166500 [Gigaspora rosea]|uniref:Uncharacterized protein n=1 Tax=Gigaspora rosea TaxID=44941 RepID=A0A397VRP3_9GLOM|nr:hypothetical protein C2G38_2166500 [Gigaspora rosea]